MEDRCARGAPPLVTGNDRPPRIWPVLIATAIGLGILITLGVWQMQRLQWKEALLAQLAANAAAPPVSLAEAAAMADPEFVRVRFTGTYQHGGWKKMIATFQGGQGWTVITPATTADGWAVMVDRGRIPGELGENFDKPAGKVVIDGVIRTHARGQGMFDPDNNAEANLWYWWDVPAMLETSGLAPGLRPYPHVVQLVPAGAAGFPRPEEPKANLANNHLGYAITWFGLAATLLAVAAFYVHELRKRRRRPGG
jgi:surfeit locus 1 family protein